MSSDFNKTAFEALTTYVHGGKRFSSHNDFFYACRQAQAVMRLEDEYAVVTPQLEDYTGERDLIKIALDRAPVLDRFHGRNEALLVIFTTTFEEDGFTLAYKDQIDMTPGASAPAVA